MNDQQPVLRKLAFAGAAILVLWVCWAQLGDLTIRLWDESRMSFNALEMYEHGHYWVTTFEHKPDLWNTKPPLMIWLQVLSLRTFGMHDWALRVPAALAATATFAALFHFCYKRLHHFWLGIFSMIILATSLGYISEHVTRTGDFESLLILWITLASLNFFLFLEQRRNPALYATFVFLGLAVCTKGIAGLMFTPGLLIYTIYRGQLKRVLTSRHTYIGILVFLFIALPYYLIREQYNPGYLHAVMGNEIGGRFLQTIEGHNHPWSWYLDHLATSLYIEWLPVFVLGLFFLWKERKSGNIMNRAVTYAAILVITYTLIVSVAKTKLMWYIAPIFPFTALVGAYGIFGASKYIYGQKSHIRTAGKFILPVFLIFVASKNVYLELYRADLHQNFNDINYYIRDKFMAEKDPQPLFVLAPGYQPHVWWYVKMANKQGQKVVNNSTAQIKTGDRVLVAKGEHMDSVTARFDVDTVYRTPFIGVLNIKKEK